MSLEKINSIFSWHDFCFKIKVQFFARLYCPPPYTHTCFDITFRSQCHCCISSPDDATCLLAPGLLRSKHNRGRWTHLVTMLSSLVPAVTHQPRRCTEDMAGRGTPKKLSSFRVHSTLLTAPLTQSPRRGLHSTCHFTSYFFPFLIAMSNSVGSLRSLRISSCLLWLYLFKTGPLQVFLPSLTFISLHC